MRRRSVSFDERFDVESLMPGVPNIEPKSVRLPNKGRKLMRKR